MTLPFEFVQRVQSKVYYNCTDGLMRASYVDLVQKVVRGYIVAQSKSKHVDYEREFLNQDAVSEKVLVEVIKVLKRASDDKASEVRLEVAKLALVLVPVFSVIPCAQILVIYHTVRCSQHRSVRAAEYVAFRRFFCYTMAEASIGQCTCILLYHYLVSSCASHCSVI